MFNYTATHTNGTVRTFSTKREVEAVCLVIATGEETVLMVSKGKVSSVTAIANQYNGKPEKFSAIVVPAIKVS